MNEKIGKFIIANWKALQKLNIKPEFIGGLFACGIRPHDVKKMLEEIDV